MEDEERVDKQWNPNRAIWASGSVVRIERRVSSTRTKRSCRNLNVEKSFLFKKRDSAKSASPLGILSFTRK